MKEKYIAPTVEIVIFGNEDILVTTSSATLTEDDFDILDVELE